MLNCYYKCGTDDFPGCNHLFATDRPTVVTCPKCQHEYITWLNYKEIERKLKNE